MYDRHRPCDDCGIDDDLAFGAAHDRLCFDCAETQPRQRPACPTCDRRLDHAGARCAWCRI